MDAPDVLIPLISSTTAYLAARWQASKAAQAAIGAAREQAAATVSAAQAAKNAAEATATATRAAAEASSAAPIIHELTERLRDVTSRVECLEGALQEVHSDVHVACRHIERIHDRCAECLLAKGVRIPDQLRRYIDPGLWPDEEPIPSDH